MTINNSKLVDIMSGKEFNYKSAVARGYANDAREYGAKNNVQGFEKPKEKGEKGGEYRREANKIVHASPGEARNHYDSAVKLAKKAHK
jgi:hypothetical protein